MTAQRDGARGTQKASPPRARDSESEHSCKVVGVKIQPTVPEGTTAMGPSAARNRKNDAEKY